jgi:hypothetical protein
MPRTMESIVPDTPPLAIGTRTQWGRIQAVGVLGGRPRERYYWMIDKHGTVSMMPASVVESPQTSGRAKN